MNYTRIFICVSLVLCSFTAQAQKKAAVKADLKKAAPRSAVIYSNQVDASLTLHNVSFLPAVDNVDGIFAKPFDKKLLELLANDHQWRFVESKFAGTFLTPQDLISAPEKVIKVAKPLKVDGIILVDIRKNAKDALVSLHLFSAKDGQLITQVTATDLDQNSMEKALLQLEELYKQMKSRIPYDGIILSRTKNRVTMNLGQADGVTAGQEVTVAKIIEVTRHPKLGSILKNEKAILGKVRLIKVDRTLSFGDVISETESGAIQQDSKVVGARMVTHTPENWIKPDYVPAELLLSEDNKVNGKIQEWKPEMPPTFGQVSASFGLSNYNQSLSLADGTSLSAKSNMYPSINMAAEIWINPEWYVDVGMSQGTGSMTNPVAAGQPAELNTTMSQYSLDLGYNLLLKDDFFDSKLFGAIGFYTYNMSIDNSAPEGLTSTKYSGMRFTLGGRTPIDQKDRWYLGASLLLYFKPSLAERPITSGTSNNSLVNFKIGVDYRWSERVFINSGIDFKTFMTDFSGGGSRTVAGTKGSQKLQTLIFGVSYMF